MFQGGMCKDMVAEQSAVWDHEGELQVEHLRTPGSKLHRHADNLGRLSSFLVCFPPWCNSVLLACMRDNESPAPKDGLSKPKEVPATSVVPARCDVTS